MGVRFCLAASPPRLSSAQTLLLRFTLADLAHASLIFHSVSFIRSRASASLRHSRQIPYLFRTSALRLHDLIAWLLLSCAVSFVCLFVLLLRNTSGLFRCVLDIVPLRHSSAVLVFSGHASVLVWHRCTSSCSFMRLLCAAACVYFFPLFTMRFCSCALRFASSLTSLHPLSSCFASASQMLLDVPRFLVLLQFTLFLFGVQSGLGVLPSGSMFGAHSTHPPLRHPVPQWSRPRPAPLHVCVD